ncbi:MAG: hypothetical protein LBC73_06965 [Oscillospiraceae bacterium]|nr:hypothetical protein [Oscillospiraceae bacterium]
MFNQIRINYPIVEQMTAKVHAELQDYLDSFVSEYNNILTDSEEFDGATQADFREAMEQEYEKTVITIRTVQKLARFIAISSERVEEIDAQLARNFQTMGQRPPRGR